MYYLQTNASWDADGMQFGKMIFLEELKICLLLRRGKTTITFKCYSSKNRQNVLLGNCQLARENYIINSKK